MSEPAGLIVTVPVDLSPATLHDTDVPETDYAAWDGGTTYNQGQRCIRNHRVWESAKDANLNHVPEDTVDDWWLDASATNRWKAFDHDQPDSTAQADSLFYEFDPGEVISAVHVLGLVGTDTVRVTLTDPTDGLVYDSGDSATGMTIDIVDFWSFFFGPWKMVNQLHYYDLPATYPEARLKIELTGAAGMSVQAITAGLARTYGIGVTWGLRTGIETDSGWGRDTWQNARLKKAPFYKWATFTLRVAPDDVDTVADFLTDARAAVMVWNVNSRFNVTKILGFCASWDQTFADVKNVGMSIRIEGVAING